MGSAFLLSVVAYLALPASSPQIPTSSTVIPGKLTDETASFRSTLDGEGYIVAGISRASYEGLRAKVKQLTGLERAQAHVGLGEFAFARLEDPKLAAYHFKQARINAQSGSATHSLATFDQGLLRLRQGAHNDALKTFRALQENRGTDLSLVGKFNLARWAKVACKATRRPPVGR